MSGTDFEVETSTGVRMFSFGEAESVLGRRDLLSYVECMYNGRWYEPPVHFRQLARALHVQPHHESAIRVKRNLLVKHFKPTALLDRATFGKWAFDYLVLGNGFLEMVPNRAGRPMRLDHSLGVRTRVGKDDSVFFLPDNVWGNVGQAHEYQPGTVFHLAEPDLGQEIYGLPEYLAALQSAFLNEAATLFRRRYYINGAHAGFVFYLSESSMDQKDVDLVRQALRDAKGVGNFKNLFINAPGGKKDGVQIIPISEVAAKDEFLGIKGTTRDDILAAHRVPPQIIAVIPQNNSGFGDVRTANDVFFRNEIEPLQSRFRELNDWLGQTVVDFDDYVPMATPPAPAGAQTAA